SLNNLANMQSAVGQRDEALETAREAVTVYRDLYQAENEAFAERLAKGLLTLSWILVQLNQHRAAALSLAEGMRIILPEVEKYPRAHLSLCVALAREYIAAIKAAEMDPDSELLSELVRVIGPHLPKPDSGESPK
ncbi:MAG: tetratricopeptide repeat protein, partial [Acidobacteriaceae bacterium]|nr:tetratricopeptide repeat protein [Acidobacteriaceae bacterium]